MGQVKLTAFKTDQVKFTHFKIGHAKYSVKLSQPVLKWTAGFKTGQA